MPHRSARSPEFRQAMSERRFIGSKRFSRGAFTEVGHMTNSPIGNDPILIWQHQDITGETMSAQEIRKTAQEFQAKSKRRRAIFGIAFLLYVVLSIVVRLSSTERFALHLGWVGVV